jgi:hypothetical protein
MRTDQRQRTLEGRPGVSRMWAWRLDNHADSSVSAATAVFRAVVNVVSRPTNSTAWEGYGVP